MPSFSKHHRGTIAERALVGFTLVELLITIGILGVLASVVLIAINPRKQISDAQDVKRKSNARQVSKGMLMGLIKNGSLPGEQAGVLLPVGSELEAKPVCRKGIAVDACHSAGGISLDSLVPEYIVDIPVDDLETNPTFSGYCVYKYVNDPRVIPAYCGQARCPSICGTYGGGTSSTSGGSSSSRSSSSSSRSSSSSSRSSSSSSRASSSSSSSRSSSSSLSSSSSSRRSSSSANSGANSSAGG